MISRRIRTAVIAGRTRGPAAITSITLSPASRGTEALKVPPAIVADRPITVTLAPAGLTRPLISTVPVRTTAPSPGASTLNRTGGLVAVDEEPPQAASASGQAAASSRARHRIGSGRVWQRSAAPETTPGAGSRAPLYLRTGAAIMRRTVSKRGSNMQRGIRVGVLAAVVGVCVLPAQASAHAVTSGESLSSVAAANGLTTDELAAANGLTPDALLIEGESLYVPDPSGSAVGGGEASTGGGEASTGGGGYVVQPGDTLSGVAAAEGLSTEDLAAANGLNADGTLVAGTTLTIPGGGGGGSASGGSTGDAPVPTSETVSPGQVGDIAASENVSPSLADAVATQESGFDNGLVSSADARGVMQILPSTWDFINGSLASEPLDPASARDNVRAGALYLGYLADHTGNDPVSTVASYYQGLGSVQSGGLLPETQQYVDSVLALRDRYRGG